jgi:hypothetical protein
MDWADV